MNQNYSPWRYLADTIIKTKITFSAILPVQQDEADVSDKFSRQSVHDTPEAGHILTCSRERHYWNI